MRGSQMTGPPREINELSDRFALDLPRHPRLLLRMDDLAALRERTLADERFERLIRRYLVEDAPAVGGAREEIKQRARRLTALGFIALVDDRESERALVAARELLRRFVTAETWNPRPVIRSFLDRAEIAVAVALCYDWLYADLSRAERHAIEAALKHHILDPAAEAYADPETDWPRRRENYTFASNAAIVLTALAVGDRFPKESAAILRSAVLSTWDALGAFAPDGAWHEGPSYWALTVRSAALTIAALESALDRSFGLADRPGFAATGQFALHVRGPSGAAFNFADSTTDFDASALGWLARRFGSAADGWQAIACPAWYLPFALIWDARSDEDPSALGLPTGKIFRGCGLACFRDTWSSASETDPVFFAIKGGTTEPDERESATAKLPLHAQADIGTFVVEGARRRWALDLGSDSYDLPGYFSTDGESSAPNRWQYYRNSAAGHNTLMVGGREQNPAARTPILSSGVGADCKWVVFDLSAAYGAEPGSILRGGSLIGRTIIVQDEIASGFATGTRWRMHTSAEPVSISATSVRLQLGEEQFQISIHTPRHARLTLNEPPPPGHFPIADPDKLHGPSKRTVNGLVAELPRRDDAGATRAGGAPLRCIDIEWPRRARRLTVLMRPQGSADAISRIAPLKAWAISGPIAKRPSGPHAGATHFRQGSRRSHSGRAMSVHDNEALR
jgi:hypothetical protein